MCIRDRGIKLRRAHPFNPALKHGFIHSQRMGMNVFEHIHPDAPIVVAEAVWQYSAHLLAGLESHRGPILTVANWSGQWPGLVGMLNLNGCLRKAGVPFTTLWSKDFKDPLFKRGLHEWIAKKSFVHDTSHVRLSLIHISELNVTEDSVMVLQNCGPKGYPGMAEVGNMGLPPKLLAKGVTDMVRISDARMSGTAYGTVVLLSLIHI